MELMRIRNSPRSKSEFALKQADAGQLGGDV
jgi:hypothetical protein